MSSENRYGAGKHKGKGEPNVQSRGKDPGLPIPRSRSSNGSKVSSNWSDTRYFQFLHSESLDGIQTAGRGWGGTVGGKEAEKEAGPNHRAILNQSYIMIIPYGRCANHMNPFGTLK